MPYPLAEWEIIEPVVKLEPDADGVYRIDLDRIVRERMLRRRDPARDRAMSVLFPTPAPPPAPALPATVATPAPAPEPEPESQGPWLSAERAAKHLGIKYSRFRKLAACIPRHPITKRYHVDTLDDVTKWDTTPDPNRSRKGKRK